MAPDQRAFVRSVLAHLGMTPTELGDKLRKANAYNAVNAWITDNAKNFRKLGYADTMDMLELCGWLSMGEAEPSTAPVADLPRDRLEVIERALLQVAANQTAVLDQLGVPESARAPIAVLPLPPAAAPKRRRRR